MTAPALFSYQIAPAVVRFEWDGVVLFSAGMEWEITATPAPPLDLHGGVMAVPQGGSVGEG